MKSTINTNSITPTIQKPMTPEQKEHELMRRELWIKIATAVAGCDTCKTIEAPARWADITLKAFDEKFNSMNVKSIDSPTNYLKEE